MGSPAIPAAEVYGRSLQGCTLRGSGVMKRFASLIAVLALGLSASASVTEIRAHFYSQTGALPSSPIMTAPAVDGSYVIAVQMEHLTCSNFDTGKGGVALATLAWDDENRVRRRVHLYNSGCIASTVVSLRIKANTVPTIQASSDSYNLFVDGFGLWPNGTQGQGGLTEPIASISTNLLGTQKFPLSLAPGVYLVLAMIVPHEDSPANAAASVSWVGEANHNAPETVTSGAQILLPIHVLANASVTVSVGSGAYDAYIYAVGFNASPAAGPGPFGDHEYTLLRWTNATYPKSRTGYTAGSSGAVLLLATNIGEVPNSGSIGEGLLTCWPSQTAVPCAASLMATGNGAPSACVSPIFLAPNDTLTFETYNNVSPQWGPSPTYSAEVDVIQF